MVGHRIRVANHGMGWIFGLMVIQVIDLLWLFYVLVYVFSLLRALGSCRF
jgi:hypothetical protein